METIAALRRRVGMTQQSLAHRLGVSVTSVASWEQGKYDPNARQFRELCRILDVDIEQIMLPSEMEGRPAAAPPPTTDGGEG